MTETINGVPLELLKRAVQIPSKASVEENHAAIVDRGRAQAELRDMLYAAPVSEAKAQGVVMPERWNVPRPMWKDARQPYGNPLNHADIEAAEKFNLALDEVARLNAATVQQDQAFCEYCGGNDEEPQDHCMDCTRPVQQVSVPDERAAFEREDRYIVIKRSDMDRIPNQKVVHSFLGALGELSAHSVRIPQRKFLVIESDWPEYDPAWKLIQDRVQGRPILDAAPAAPAADAGHVFYGMDGNHP